MLNARYRPSSGVVNLCLWGCLLTAAGLTVSHADDTDPTNEVEKSQDGFFASLTQQQRDRELQRAERLLKDSGIVADVEGVRQYLKAFFPTEDQRRRALGLVEALGDLDYRRRNSAMRELMATANPPLAALKRAAAGKDPEVRRRVATILKTHEQRHVPLLHALMIVIARKPLRGLTAEVLAGLGHLDRPLGAQLGVRALRATTEKRDLALLRSALRSGNADVQAGAAEVLPHVAGDEALKDLRRFLNDAKAPPVVRLAAGRAFAEAGRREALTPLLKLLDADDVETRAQAAALLRALTGTHFGFAAYDSLPNRAAAVKKWVAWRSTTGKTALLQHPLKPFSGYESYLDGHRLLAFGYRNKVVELDAEGKEVWTYPAQGAFSAEKLSNGNVLIACYGPNEVVEVSPQKKIVWQLSVPSCLNARPLPNGNVLVACHTARKVLEVDRGKHVVWKYSSRDNCYDAHRLPNGNTMISSDKGIVEVTPGGKTVWQWKPANGRCYGFHPLPNGHILAALYSAGAVREITRDRKVVWSFDERGAFDAFRLPNGNTLVSSSRRFVEVDRQRKVLWTHAGNQHGRARK